QPLPLLSPAPKGCAQGNCITMRRSVKYSLGSVALLARRGLGAGFVDDAELDAPVGGAAGRGLVAGDRLLLAEAVRLEPVGRHTVVDEVLHDALGATVREIAVVLGLAAIVRVPLD